MTALQFGVGWKRAGYLGDRSYQRPRTLLWVSDLGWALFDDGHEIEIIRRGLYDEVAVRCRLLGWQDYVDVPNGADWATDRIQSGAPGWAPPAPDQQCPVCWGEGFVAGPEGIAVRCPCEATR